jgi:hypothetical protein
MVTQRQKSWPTVQLHYGHRKGCGHLVKNSGQ